MSYKNQPVFKKVKLFYPTYIKTDDKYNIVIPTGPYRKDVAGSTADSVFMYCKHLQEIVAESISNDNKKKESLQSEKLNDTQ